MDINKKGSREGEKKVPESLGLASGVVFLVRSRPPPVRLPLSALHFRSSSFQLV